MRINNGQSIWTRNYICILLANFLMQISNFSTNTLVSTYASFLGAAPTLMGLMTGMFYGISLAMRPVAGPVQARVNHSAKSRVMIPGTTASSTAKATTQGV